MGFLTKSQALQGIGQECCFDTVDHGRRIEGLPGTIKDGGLILCKSRKSAKRTPRHIIAVITENLSLKTNPGKTAVSQTRKVEYPGYSFCRHKGTCRMRVHPRPVRQMKNRHRELTVRGNRWSDPEREEEFRARHLPEWKAYELANCRKGTVHTVAGNSSDRGRRNRYPAGPASIQGSGKRNARILHFAENPV